MPYLIIAALVVLTAGTSGCAKKTGVQLSEKTTASMQDVQQSIQQASAQIDATNATLSEVLRTGQANAQPSDIRKSFEAYSGNVNKMDKTAKTVSKHIDEMTARGSDYFEEWSKSGETYTNPQMQRLSAQERMRLSRSFEEIASSSAGMRGALNAYLSEIKQIQTYLSNNLTANGIAAVAPIAQAAARDGAELKRSLQPTQTAIERARLEMMPGGAAAGGVPSTQWQQPLYQQPQNQQLMQQNQQLMQQNQQLMQQNQQLQQQNQQLQQQNQQQYQQGF
jgi:hypothetical protein